MLYVKRRAPEKGQGKQRGARLQNCLGGYFRSWSSGSPVGPGLWDWWELPRWLSGKESHMQDLQARLNHWFKDTSSLTGTSVEFAVFQAGTWGRHVLVSICSDTF